MPHSVEYDPQTDIIHIKVEGPLTLAIVRDVSNAAALLSKERGCLRILNDLREASIQLSMLEIYSLPGSIAKITSALGLPVHNFRRAVVLPEGTTLLPFFETVSRNRMQNVTLFHDIEAARKWLLEK